MRAYDSQASTALFGIARGKRGTRQTLELMKSIVNRFKTNIKMREFAQRIIDGVEQKNWLGEAEAIQNWVRDNVRYTRDVSGVETIATPDHTLYTRHGDCDDQSILVATMLESVGHPTRFAAVGTRPGILSHVYTEVKIDGEWLPVETTESWKIGQGPPIVKTKLVLNNRTVKNIGGYKKGKIAMQDFAQRERLLELDLDAVFELDGYDDGLGFHKRLKKFRKKAKSKLRKVVRKVAKVVAVAAAVYFTGGALIGPALALANQKKMAKAQEDAAIAENTEIERQNKIVEAQQIAYDREQAMLRTAETQALRLAAKSGVKIKSPQARAYLRKSIQLERDKLEAGISPGGGIMKKLLPVAAIGIPIAMAIAA